MVSGGTVGDSLLALGFQGVEVLGNALLLRLVALKAWGLGSSSCGWSSCRTNQDQGCGFLCIGNTKAHGFRFGFRVHVLGSRVLLRPVLGKRLET